MSVRAWAGCSRPFSRGLHDRHEAGEIATLRLSPRTEAIVDWVRSLPGPVAVTYEAGPTGFGLARALTAAGCGARCGALEGGSPPGDRVRPTAVTRSGWPGCYGSGSSLGRVPSGPKRPRGIWCGLGRTPAGPMRARHRLRSCCCARGSSGDAPPGPAAPRRGCDPSGSTASGWSWRSTKLDAVLACTPDGTASTLRSSDGRDERASLRSGPLCSPARGRASRGRTGRAAVLAAFAAVTGATLVTRWQVGGSYADESCPSSSARPRWRSRPSGWA